MSGPWEDVAIWKQVAYMGKQTKKQKNKQINKQTNTFKAHLQFAKYTIFGHNSKRHHTVCMYVTNKIRI